MPEKVNIARINPSSAITAFKPRQVLLAERNSEAMDATPGQKKIAAPNPEQKAVLLHAVLLFLERGGFPKALKRLLSEARIEDGTWKTSSLDLEEMYCIYLKTGNESAKEKSTVAAGEELHAKLKKKKKSKNIFDSFANTKDPELDTNESESRQEDKSNERNITSDSPNRNKEEQLSVLETENSSKKGSHKKKKKNIDEDQLDQSFVHADGNSQDALKKVGKKKNKRDTSLAESAEQCGLEDKSTIVPLEGKKSESKKKRKKGHQKLQKLPGDETGIADVLEVENHSKSEAVQILGGSEDKDNKDTKKRKRVEKSSRPLEEVQIGSEELKRRKVEGFCKSSNEQHVNADSTPSGDGINKTGVNGQVDISSPTKVEKQAYQSLGINGYVKSDTESNRKQQNGSNQSSVKYFQRVKVDDVKFADERLQDNSYWAKSGAEVGYGAKAQEVLGQVRGRDFRHEKTKKKRGSYKGGLIDLHSHSVKFNYSDDD